MSLKDKLESEKVTLTNDPKADTRQELERFLKESDGKAYAIRTNIPDGIFLVFSGPYPTIDQLENLKELLTAQIIMALLLNLDNAKVEDPPKDSKDVN